MLTKLTPYWPILLLILAVLTLFGPALLHPDHILYPTFSPYSDTMIIHWPKARLMAQTWQAGEGLPLWTPLNLSGMPLAANQLAMLFYPPAWLFLILSTAPVFNLLFVFHLVLGGIGVYFLLRQGYILSSTAAFLGGLTFALNGKWLAHAAAGHVSMVGAIGWLPWAVWGLVMVLQGSKVASSKMTSSKVAGNNTASPATQPPNSSATTQPPNHLTTLLPCCLVAISLAMQIVTHTLLVIYTVYLLAALIIWYGVFICPQRQAALKRLWLPLLIIPILAGLLGAAQGLPLWELTGYSNRALSPSQAAEYALSPGQLLVGLLLPSAQGGHEYVIYLGLTPLLLAPLGLTRRQRWTWFYGLLVVFTVLFALGPATPLHGLFYRFAPGFGWVRTPARMFFVGGLAVAVLVGFGVDRLRQADWSAKTIKWLTRLTVAGGGLAFMVGLGLVVGFGQVNRAAIGLAIFAPLTLALIVLRARRVLSAQAALISLGLLLYLDLASFDLTMLRFTPLDEALSPGRAAAEYIRGEAGGLFRVYSPSYSLPSQTAVAASLQLADGVEPVHLAGYDQFMARAGGYHNADFSVTIPNFGGGPPESALRDIKPNLKLLGLLNVVYLASAFPLDDPDLSLETQIEGTYIYRNQVVLPRAWVAYQTISAEDDWLAQLEKLPNLANVVIVDGEQVTQKPPVIRPQSPVTITHYSANRLELTTDITAPGWLVVSEIWYPGWQATVNGTPQPVEKVDGLLRGVYLSQAGSYHATLEYRPWAAVWGGWISGVTAGGLILVGLWLGVTYYRVSSIK